MRTTVTGQKENDYAGMILYIEECQILNNDNKFWEELMKRERGLLIVCAQHIVYMIISYKTNQSLKQWIMVRLNGRT